MERICNSKLTRSVVAVRSITTVEDNRHADMDLDTVLLPLGQSGYSYCTNTVHIEPNL